MAQTPISGASVLRAILGIVIWDECDLRARGTVLRALCPSIAPGRGVMQKFLLVPSSGVTSSEAQNGSLTDHVPVFAFGGTFV